MNSGLNAKMILPSMKFHLTHYAALPCLLLALVGAGCSSLKESGAAGFASVTIQGRSPEQIIQVTQRVFRENGYFGSSTGGGQMVFQKQGSRMDDISYGGLGSAYYGANTMVRVKAEVVELGGDSHRLQCQAYIVRDAGDLRFEEEQRLAGIRRGPYQALLDKVAAQLK